MKKSEIRDENSEIDDLAKFISSEFNKINVEPDDDLLEYVISNTRLENKDHQKVKHIVRSMMNNKSVQVIQNHDLRLNQFMDILEKNSNLSDLVDNRLHFGKKHLNIAKRIFLMQITQNYLSFLKFYFLDDLLKRQSSYNSATIK